eukprot:TRINITY_DN2380_c0_g1_i1.p1 TRINITY_DN2380_c0_g1~~TRINITY_DN2380_c0_g1_i1.p1  ORF type:complete len:435 (-),score=121.19 TRINITY_DN2380_c0_g1_i1:133-1374(-)
MTRFYKAGAGPEFPELGKQAINEAINDAKLKFDQVNCAVAGYNYGDPASGQRVVYEVGITGIPVFNVNNNCSTGSNALLLASQLIKSGEYDCALAVGFEKMEKNLSQRFTDAGYTSPVDRHFDHLFECGAPKQPLHPLINDITGNVIKMFGEAAIEHQKKYQTTDKQFALISYKNHKHSVNNERALFQKEIPLESIMDKKRYPLYGPLTTPQASSTADGAAAAIVVSEKFLKQNRHLEAQAIEIVSQVMLTDLPSSFGSHKSFIDLCGADMVKKGAERLFQKAKLSIKDVDVLEVHDCFSSNELMITESLGLCKEGEGGKLYENGEWISNKQGGELYKVGGRWVVNPSGGLESKGHPIGATGLAQCAELNWQLRGIAGKRQVEGAKVGLQHNFGLGSSLVLTLYKSLNTKAKL